MAFAEKRGEWYRIVFRYNGKRYRQTLDTDDPTVADSAVCGVKRTLMLLEQKALRIPEGADALTFILSGGQINEAPKPNRHVVKDPTTLALLKEQYIETLSVGAVEESSLNTLRMHLRHIERTIGSRFHLDTLALADLQQHVNRRVKAKGMRGRRLSPVTIRKEIASFRAAWNWGVQASLVRGPFPNKGLKFPKLDEKPPFQTWDEIDRRISVGGLTKNQIAEFWDCLYLRKPEIAELLAFLKEKGTMPWVYPLVCMAAHTGARRSELVRIEIADVDFDRNTILIREKKRSREKRTTRRVALTPFLKQVLLDWLKVHPGGPFLFAQGIDVVRSKKKRAMPTPITRNEVHDHFKRSLADGKWKVLRGLHLLRHSFISCLAAAGVDQRIIDELAGHQTPEQQKRYRHLAPDVKQEAVARVTE
jgi:integrase